MELADGLLVAVTCENMRFDSRVPSSWRARLAPSYPAPRLLAVWSSCRAAQQCSQPYSGITRVVACYDSRVYGTQVCHVSISCCPPYQVQADFVYPGSDAVNTQQARPVIATPRNIQRDRSWAPWPTVGSERYETAGGLSVHLIGRRGAMHDTTVSSMLFARVSAGAASNSRAGVP